MSCFPTSAQPISEFSTDITGLDRVVIRHTHIGGWEQSQGAQCPHCHAVLCPGVYYGVCGYDDPYSVECPCGCEQRVDEETKTSYAYARTGENATNREAECAASIWPQNEINAHLLQGQRVLGEIGTERYSYLIMESGGALVGLLFYDDEPVSYIGEQGQVGVLIGFLHGEMMRHAADYPGAFRIRAGHFRSATTV